MRQLVLPLLLAAAAAVPAHAQPASLRGISYSVPPGYTAAPGLGDSLTALYTRARTAVFVAALPDGMDRGVSIVRIRGLLARAVAPQDGGALQWRPLSSGPVSPFDVYHEGWIGYDGSAAVIASVHHLRKDGRDVLMGSAFHTRDGQPEQMFRTGISTRTHALSSRASGRLVAELVGDPPPVEEGIDFGGTGGGTPAPEPVDPEEAAIRAAFEAYRAALLARDGEGALPHVSQAVVEYYGNVQQLALYAGAAEVRARPLSDQLFVLMLRQRIAPERLRGMAAGEVFAHGVAQGWISDESARTQQLGRVGVMGNMAIAETLVRGRPSPVRLHFVRTDGAWRWDMLSVIQSVDAGLRSAAERAGATPEALMAAAVERVTGQAVTPALWDAPLPRPEGR